MHKASTFVAVWYTLTHGMMRGTLHIVAAADVRWMLELLTPRVVARSARRLRQQFSVDEAVLTRSRQMLVRALQGGQQLSRNAMYQALEAAHISTAGGRGLQILWRLAQEGLVCFGAREGKQHIITLTFWESLEAIKGFAGDNIELAKYYPEDKDFMLEFEPTVVHYEVVGHS
jgi:hypothetical protein